jgi:hypothetical protein
MPAGKQDNVMLTAELVFNGSKWPCSCGRPRFMKRTSRRQWRPINSASAPARLTALGTCGAWASWSSSTGASLRLLRVVLCPELYVASIW